MATLNNPSAKAGENTDIIAARREAAAKLLPLFGGKTADGKEVVGVFHNYGIAAVVGASADNAKFVDELRGNPHAKSLAVVAAARGNKNFPPAMVAELFSRPEVDEDNDWFSRVYLGGLAEVFAATGVGLMLPPSQAGIDLARGAFNVVNHLSDEERKKLGLCEADEAPRQQLATDLMAILDEEKPASLTPAQQLYRWALRKWDERQERREAKAVSTSAGDPAAALPKVVAPPEPPEPEVPKAPVIPDLSALTGGGSTPAAPKTPRANKKTGTVAPATPGEEPKPTTATATDEDRELILAAIEAAGTPAAKAMLALVRSGKRTVAEAAVWATSKGLL